MYEPGHDDRGLWGGAGGESKDYLAAGVFQASGDRAMSPLQSWHGGCFDPAIGD